MQKHNNYDTKSSLFSVDYKIPYDLADSTIVEHLEESQEELEFLKLKLTEAYDKIESEIIKSIELEQQNDELLDQLKLMTSNCEGEKKENEKLKQAMRVILENRKIQEQELEYTHKRYKKMLADKQAEYEAETEDLTRQNRKLKLQITRLQQDLGAKSSTDSRLLRENRDLKDDNKSLKEKQVRLQEQIDILNHQIKKLTAEKVTEVSRLKLQIDCYQRSVSPIKTHYVEPRSRVVSEAHEDKENCFSQIVVNEEKMVESNVTQDSSVGKWKKTTSSKGGLTDDQKLTKCQLNRKRVEGQLIKLERLKRHTQSDREVMERLEREIYEIDSQISSLKRKIRQNY